jgi:NOL1/NOP2/sun family putative RNA methylase
MNNRHTASRSTKNTSRPSNVSRTSDGYNASTKRGLHHRAKEQYSRSSRNNHSSQQFDDNQQSYESRDTFSGYHRRPKTLFKPQQTRSPDEWLDRYAKWGFAQNPIIELPQTIRLNTLKTKTLPNIPGATFTQIPFLRYGYTVSSSFNIVSSAAYLGGLLHIQESASQLAVELLQPKPGMTVLDVCCAPSSKTAQLSACMENTGTIIGVDSDFDRLQKSCYMLERLGVTNTTLIHMDAKKIANLPYSFDMILLDAPCSGNFAIDRKWFAKRTLADIQQLAQKQKVLLQESLKLLKVGGTLMYCTCSLEQEENEEVIESVLSESIVLCQLPDTIATPGLTSKTKLAKRMWPTQHGCSGFFYALLQKKQ